VSGRGDALAHDARAGREHDEPPDDDAPRCDGPCDARKTASSRDRSTPCGDARSTFSSLPFRFPPKWTSPTPEWSPMTLRV